MPAPTHTRVTFSGIFGATTGPSEIWNFGLHFGPLQATTAAAATTIAGNLITPWTSYMKPMFTSDVVLTKVRVAVVAADGHVAKDFDGSYKQGDWVGVNAGSGTRATGTGYLPLQTAMVGSLSSARPDATGKGRFFLPFPGVYALAADYRLGASDAQSLAGSLKSFINAAVTAVQAPLVIASSKGYLSNVTTVRVGRVPDTMRSRRNQELEAYSVLSL